MLSRFKNFFDRNKRKIIIGGIILAGTGLAIQYAQRKLTEFRDRQIREFFEKTRKIQHFELTEKTCDQAISGLLPAIFGTVSKLLDTEKLLVQLRSTPERKLEVWEEIKITAFARVIALVYGTTLLTASLRVLTNVIGGYMYKQTTENIVITRDIQTRYNLAIIHHLMNNGLPNLINIIQIKTKQIVSKFNLKQKMSLCDLEQIIWSVQTAINKDIDKNISKFILSVNVCEEQEINILKTMLCDTLDVLESKEFNEICESSFNSGFSIVTDKIADFYASNVDKTKNKSMLNGSDTKEGSEVVDVVNFNINDVKIPLAKIIPILNALAAEQELNNITPNNISLISSLCSLTVVNQSLKTLGANIYEVYCQ